jgi:hypothetical protein
MVAMVEAVMSDLGDRVVDLLARDVWLALISGAVAAGIALAISWWFYRRSLNDARRFFREAYEIQQGGGAVTLDFDERNRITVKTLHMP